VHINAFTWKPTLSYSKHYDHRGRLQKNFAEGARIGDDWGAGTPMVMGSEEGYDRPSHVYGFVTRPLNF